MKVKHRLPQLMADNKIRTVSELAIKSNYDYFKLNRFYKNEHKHLDPELVAAVCKALNAEISDLLYLEKEGA